MILELNGIIHIDIIEAEDLVGNFIINVVICLRG